jgi:hypothetical protein
MFDIYVSDNGGAFTSLLTGTTQTSISFTGQNGHTYGFYSVATDNLGDSQATPSSAQATTTVDTVAPTSSVTALPSFEPGMFTVTWSGSDNSGGSGLATFDVFVSDNGGAFSALLTVTTQTSTSFTGQNGHAYGFYSVATDNVGNRQTTPLTAQSSTATDAVAPSSSVDALAAFSKPSLTVSWSGSDNPGAPGASSGIASYSIYVSDNGAAFTPLLTDTRQTSATFNGMPEHTYTFYSVATDNAGNIQPAASIAQATTQTLLDTPSKLYVAAVYQDLLLRSIDLGGLNFWSKQLDQGAQRAIISAQLTHSAEYYQTNVIKPAYQKFLNRAADAAGLAFWTIQLQGGMTDEKMQAGFIASDEFYRLANQGSAPIPVTPAHDRAWVDALYQVLLGRGPDQAGEDFWTGQLQGTETRLQVANGFTGSTEGLSVRIQQTYQRYLGRTADAGGLAFWLSKYQMGAVNEDIVTGFISSAEFFKQATM